MTSGAGRGGADQAFERDLLGVRAVVDALPVIIFIVDDGGGTLFVNRFYEDYTGQSACDFDADAWGAVLHPDDREAAIEAWRYSEQTRAPFTIEYRLRAADGGYRWHLARARSVAADSGTAHHWFGTVVDIDDRRRAEERLAAREEQFRLAAEVAGVGGFEYRFASGSTRWSDEAYRIHGIAPGTLLTEARITRLTHPEDEPHNRAWMARVLHGLDDAETQYRIRREDDGETRWVRARVRVFRAADGTALRIVGAIRDITVERAAVERLAANEEMLRLAQDASGVGTYDWHLATDTLVWSDGCRRVFGVARDTPVDFRRVQSLIHPDDRDHFDRAAAAALDLGGDGHYATEYRIVRPDGAVRWIDARGRVLSEGSGATRRPTRFLGTVIDVTERKAVEAELADALAMRDVLLHEVNHRVKNSLQVVTSLLTLQAGRLPEGEARRPLADAQARIAVVAAIHQRLYQSGRHGFINLAAQGRALVEDIVRAGAAMAAVTLRFHAPPTLDLGLAQAVPLSLVINELVSNACKYAWPGRETGRLDVTIGVDGKQVSLVVADDGVGLPQGFDPKSSGGLGMRIVAALARQLRGRLEISGVGEGGGASFALAFERDEIR